MSSLNMRPDTLWAIRDLRGVTQIEKHVLLHIEMRGEFRKSVENACEEIGISKATWKRTIASLKAKGLIECRKRSGKPSCYRVLSKAVDTMGAHSEPPSEQNEAAQTEPHRAHSEPQPAHTDPTGGAHVAPKKTMKKTERGTEKHTSVVSGPPQFRRGPRGPAPEPSQSKSDLAKRRAIYQTDFRVGGPRYSDFGGRCIAHGGWVGVGGLILLKERNADGKTQGTCTGCHAEITCSPEDPSEHLARLVGWADSQEERKNARRLEH